VGQMLGDGRFFPWTSGFSLISFCVDAFFREELVLKAFI